MTRIKRNKFGMGILVAFICLCAVGCHDSGGDQSLKQRNRGKPSKKCIANKPPSN